MEVTTARLQLEARVSGADVTSNEYEQLPVEDERDDTDTDIGTLKNLSPFTDYFSSVVRDCPSISCAVDAADDDTAPANVTLSRPSFSQVFVVTLLTLCSAFVTTTYCCSELYV